MAPDSLALDHADVHVTLRLRAKGMDTTASCCMVAPSGEGGAPTALVIM
jgi:hypothetical protein